MTNQNFSWTLKAGALVAALLASSCAEQAISELEQAKLEGAPFAKHLAMEYEAFAKKNSREYNHNFDARHFAVKGLQAATGLAVLPEDPRGWDLQAGVIPAITEGRERLTWALEKSGREVAPALAAQTQVMYDCWVQESENEHNSEAGICQKGFTEKLRALEAAVNQQAPAFTVFFDMSSSKINAQGDKIIDEVAKIARNLSTHTVTITGNTDAGGGRKHNLILSQNRAAVVRDALIARGIPAGRIVAVGGGELDGREIETKNRRVDIQIR